MTVAAVVLAAGAGRRFTASGGPGPKQLVSVAGRTMIDVVLDAACEADLDEVLMIQGAVDLTDPIGSRAGGRDVVVLDNPRWSDGLATSLQVGIAAARSRGHDAVVVGLADQPAVPAAAWTAVGTAPAVPPIAVATYGGRRGNPVRLHEAVWNLLPTTGDHGARDLMAQRPDLIAEVPCAGDPHDIDTKEDLEGWT